MTAMAATGITRAPGRVKAVSPAGAFRETSLSAAAQQRK